MSKIVLYIASSLDGYIARTDGSLDWLNNHPNPDNTDYGYGEFLQSISAIVMGRITYEEVIKFGIPWPYKGIPTYVTTSNEQLDITTPDTHRYSGDLSELSDSLKKMTNNDIWLVGGGKLVTHFLNLNLIDRIILTIMPVLLGEGILLFPGRSIESQWKLNACKAFGSGVVSVTYDRV